MADTPLALHADNTANDIDDDTTDKNADKAPFFRDGHAWFLRRDDNSAQILTNFHLEIIRIIKKYDYENRRWERSFDVQFTYTHKGRTIKSPVIELEPKQTGIPTEFSNAIWDVDFRSCYIINPITLKAFITYLYTTQKPKEVHVYDYFGFITIDKEPYYLTKNALIRPNLSNPYDWQCIAPDADGVFHVSEDVHISLDPHLEGAPWLETMGVPEDGMYKEAMFTTVFPDETQYDLAFRNVEEHLKEMISGQDESCKPEGSLIMGYVFSHLIFDDVFTTFNHVIYLYLYGKGNTGKNSLVEIIRMFFGLPFAASPNATLSALETLLGTHSKLPLWMDEFIPENTPGKQNHIKDQFWNSYFQLIPRPVSSKNRYKTATPKVVRSNVLFSSNYLPTSDHFSSRLLKIEYKLDKRGGEEHYRWLQNNHAQLQNLFLAAFRESQLRNRRYIRKELFYLKKRLYEQCKAELEALKEKEGAVYTLHDRQVEQYASVYLSYEIFRNLLGNGYYKFMETYYSNPELPQELRAILDGMADSNDLWQYSIRAIIKNSLEEAEKDPLTEFLDVVGDLVRSPGSPNHIMQESDFHWTGDDVLIYWAKVWNRYAKQVGPQEAVQVKMQIERSMDALDSHGKRHNINWTDLKTTGKTVRGKGYRIVNAAHDPRFALAFDYPQDMQNSIQSSMNIDSDDKTPF